MYPLIFGFYQAFGRSVIYDNAVPFERRFISQLLCKFDGSLSQESIRKAEHFQCLIFLFATDHRHMFFPLLRAEG